MPGVATVRRAGSAPRPTTLVLLAVVLAAVLVLVSAHIPVRGGGRALDPLGYVLLVAAGVATACSVRWPRVAVAVVTVVLCVFVLRSYPGGPVWLTGIAVLAVLAWCTNRRTAFLGTAALLVALTLSAIVGGGIGLIVPLVFLGWCVAAVLLGEALHNRQRYLAGVAERSRLAERGREEETARHVAEERLRIAHDLHDGVAHAITTINVQAGAAVHVLSRRPEAAASALAVIQQASADVLDELAAMLAVLRDETDRAERAPAPGLAELGRLVATAEVSGLAVRLHTDPAAYDVPASVATAAYRVVQESLTNVLRHSAAGTAAVEVSSPGHGALLVEVRDPGPPRAVTRAVAGAGSGSGVGLVGLRERVAASGGVLSAGPDEAGFVVRAEWSGR